MYSNGRPFYFISAERNSRQSVLSLILAGLFLFCSATAAAEDDDDGVEFFEQKIRPILMDHCYKCHSSEADEPSGGFLADTKDGIRRGGETGPAVVPEDLDESLLISAIEYRALEMPPDEKLDEEVIADFKKWIQMGAPDPRTDDDDHSAVEEFANAIQHSPELEGLTCDIAMAWRVQKRKAFGKLYSTEPETVSKSVCQVFTRVVPQQLLFVALSVPWFVEIPTSSRNDEPSFVAKWEPLRNAQYQQLVASKEFRQRFVQLAVWQSSFLGDELTDQHAGDDAVGNDPAVECRGIQARIDDGRKACMQTGELSSCEMLNCAMLMELTSRGDLVERLGQGESLKAVFLEWCKWFEDAKSQLVQRRDGAGWVRMEVGSSDVQTRGYPTLQLPIAPHADLPQMPASIREILKTTE